jgi:hypothetical protein
MSRNKTLNKLIHEQFLEKDCKKYKIISPADKTKKTQDINLKGRITLKQYLFLIEHNYNGDDIKGWTCYKAYNTINKICK